MRVLIFEEKISGHHLEYIHHLYLGALAHPQNEYVIVVPEEFYQVKDNFLWDFAKHIQVVTLEERVMIRCNALRGLKRAFFLSRVISNYVKRYCSEEIYLITLMSYMPFLPFLIGRRVSIKGIIYKIFLYDREKPRLSTRVRNLVLYAILARKRNLRSVFLLNDERAPQILNTKFRTTHFKFLVDPLTLDGYGSYDLRKDLSISSDQKIFLHFGGMDRRKGTLKIFEAIEKLPKQEINNYTFVFAGRVYESIKKEFYDLFHQLKEEAHIIVIDEFVSYNYICSLCYTCDVILIPYTNISQSSGVLGYAAYYNKPLIGPADGLLGDIIKTYHLGITLNNYDAECLSRSFKEDIHIDGSRYVSTRTVKNFVASFYE